MPERGGINLEVARRLNENGVEEGDARGLELAEILEAILLALVTLATAWSGYQAARWDGRNALYYGEASRQRVVASQDATLGSQQRLFDVTTFNSWLQAELARNFKLAALFERRFTPGYKVAFNAWLQLDPFLNPKAPPGPSFMPQYHNALLERSDALDAQAAVTFQKGTDARETADSYVRITLILASVLFLLALAQRFKVRNVRRALVGLAAILLLVSLFALSSLPLD
jgi:hypothetical protein